MRIFNLDNEYSIVCNWENTRYGFRHLATLHKSGMAFEIAKAKVCYYNRTWERFEFESVIVKLIEDNFTGWEKEKFLEVIKNLNG
jgi:hypothetical protein